jgi:hypothetical protein
MTWADSYHPPSGVHQSPGKDTLAMTTILIPGVLLKVGIVALVTPDVSGVVTNQADI